MTRGQIYYFLYIYCFNLHVFKNNTETHTHLHNCHFRIQWILAIMKILLVFPELHYIRTGLLFCNYVIIGFSDTFNSFDLQPSCIFNINEVGQQFPSTTDMGDSSIETMLPTCSTPYEPNIKRRNRPPPVQVTRNILSMKQYEAVWCTICTERKKQSGNRKN